MGYRCSIKTDSYINEADIQDIVNHLPEEYSLAFLGNSKQDWGWSCRCDVYNPEGNCIDIGGAYGVSSDIAEPFVNYFEMQLKLKGYNILRKDWNW